MVSVGFTTKKPSKAPKEIEMENTTNNTQPEAVPAPATAPVQAAPAPAAVPAPGPAAKIEIPKTTGKTPGGWNRFAGYNPNDAKNKQGGRDKDRGQRKRG